MRELTVFTIDDVGGPLGTVRLEDKWRVPRRSRGVTLVRDGGTFERPWHSEQFHLPLTEIGVDLEAVRYWHHPEKGPGTDNSPKRAIYMLGLSAVPLALADVASDAQILKLTSRSDAAYEYGYSGSRLALCEVVRAYRDAKRRTPGTIAYRGTNLHCSFRYEVPEEKPHKISLLKAMGIKHPEML